MDTASLYAYACSYRVDAVVIGLNCNLCPVTRYADDFLDGNQTVENLRNFLLEESFQEYAGGSGKYDARVVVLHLNLCNDGLDGISLAEEVRRNLLALRQNQLVVSVIANQNFLFPNLVNFSNHNLTDLVFVVVEKVGLVYVHDSSGEVLPQVENGSSSERRQRNFL